MWLCQRVVYVNFLWCTWFNRRTDKYSLLNVCTRVVIKNAPMLSMVCWEYLNFCMWWISNSTCHQDSYNICNRSSRWFNCSSKFHYIPIDLQEFFFLNELTRALEDFYWSYGDIVCVLSKSDFISQLIRKIFFFEWLDTSIGGFLLVLWWHSLCFILKRF